MPYLYALELLALVFFAWQISRALGRIAHELYVLRGGDTRADKIDAKGPPEQADLD